MREQTYHIYLDSRQKTTLLHSLVELKNQLIQQGRYTVRTSKSLMPRYRTPSVQLKPRQREKAFSLMTKTERLPQLMSSSERRWQTLARSKETKIELTAYDDLFETDQSREEAKLSIRTESTVSR